MENKVKSGKKQKKSILVIAGIVAAEILVVVLLIVGYNLFIKEKPKKPPVTIPYREQIKTNVLYVTDAVLDIKPKKSSYTDIFDIKYKFESVLPQVNVNTNDVKELNKQLKDIYAQHVKKFDECEQVSSSKVADKKGLISCYTNLTYSTSETDDVVSILIMESYSDNLGVYLPKYYSYFIEKETGKVLTANELMKMFNVTEKMIQDSVEKAYREFAKENNLSISNNDYSKTKTNSLKNGVIYVNHDQKLSIVYEGYNSKNPLPYSLVATIE